MITENRVDLTELRKLVEAEIVDEIPDPEGSPLRIYNYTFRAQIDKIWNPITRASRGLVVGLDGVIHARPLEKFFNAGEAPETRWEALPAQVPLV